VNCPACRHTNPHRAKFCLECGASIGARCAGCASELPPAAKFCLECGASVAGTAPAHAASPSVERSPRSYTPKHLADKILQSKSALEGERKQVTVLFADVKGSMELAEQLDPEAWHRILECLFEILSEGVHRFEGTVNQYTGDGIMALFGAPIAHEDHAQRACYAALHLRDEIARYATEVKREHGLGFSTRMGIHSGDVVVGKIGDDLRMDYTAQGHTVGLAQRMESLASPDSCYLTAATAALVGGYFALEDLGEFRVKGVAEPVRVHRLAGIGAARNRFDISRARGLSRFVGRAADLRTLDDALEQTSAGNGQVVGVVAMAGTGKSRLCFELLERCRARGMSIFEGRAVAHGKNIPFLPILEVFRAYYGITLGDDDRSAREKIAGHMVLLDLGFADALPLLFDFLGVADPQHPAPRLDPEARQRQILAVMRQIIRSVNEAQPTVTLVEDLHWLDDASEEFLAEMVDARAGSRNLLLLNFRPEYHADWMQKSWYRQIPLTPLGRDAIAELLADLLGSDPSLAALATPIPARTGGNPFFTEEVAQTLIESGHLEGTRGAYRLVTPIERLEVPATVQAVLAARIDRLPEREKRLLQVAAVIGKDFAAATHHWGRVRVLLRELPGDREAAELGIAACTQLLNASWRVGTGLGEARALLEEGQTLANAVGDRRAHLILSMVYGRARCSGGDVAEYLDVAVGNRRIALDLDDVDLQANACFYLVDALCFAARFPEALQMAEEGLARFPRHTPPERWIIGFNPYSPFSFWRAYCLTWMGRLPEGLEELARARRLIEQDGTPELLGYAHIVASAAHYHAGDADRTLASARQLEDISRRLGDPGSLVAYAHSAFSYAHLAAARPADTIEPARAALDICGRVEKHAAGESAMLLAAALLQAGDPSAAQAAAEQAIALCQGSPARPARSRGSRRPCARAAPTRWRRGARRGRGRASRGRRADRKHRREDARTRTLRVARRARRRARRHRSARATTATGRACLRRNRRPAPRAAAGGAASGALGMSALEIVRRACATPIRVGQYTGQSPVNNSVATRIAACRPSTSQACSARNRNRRFKADVRASFPVFQTRGRPRVPLRPRRDSPHCTFRPLRA
jgi:class 3 adenylate cyclase/tetratricopeptide (TPR) repeat protein